jgi:hypothetical protein
MMKNTLVAITLIATPLTVFADHGPGCGWGTQLFEGKSGVGPHIMAATTNGTLGNQTFGMTSGTGGCDKNAEITADAADFINDNLEKVAQNMSAGQGEALETLASLMGIADQDKAVFFSLTQAHFSTIFTNEAVNGQDVISAVEAVMEKDSSLAKYLG